MKKFDKPESHDSDQVQPAPVDEDVPQRRNNPWFAVTDENGKFEIKGLPPGEYTLVAVHEKLGEANHENQRWTERIEDR